MAGFGDTPSRAGHLTLSETAAADLGVTSGDTVDLAGSAFTVDSITADSWYSHTPVVWLPLTDWQNMAAASGRPGIFASVLAVNGDSTATVPVTHDQRLFPLMDSVQIMDNGTLMMSRQSVTA